MKHRICGAQTGWMFSMGVLYFKRPRIVRVIMKTVLALKEDNIVPVISV
jgi:hypothetical protein